jgi:hypothetical protein
LLLFFIRRHLVLNIFQFQLSTVHVIDKFCN